jgi:hypothetical protein
MLPPGARGAQAPALRYPPGLKHVKHRKNAAEWVMWLLLWPIDRLLRWWY